MLRIKTGSGYVLAEGVEVTCAPAKDGKTIPAPQFYDWILQL